MAEQLSDISVVDRKPKIEGRNMVTMLLPKTEHDKTDKNNEKKEAPANKAAEIKEEANNA